MRKWKQLLGSALAAVMLLNSTVIVHADDTKASAETATVQVPLYQSGASSATNAISSRAASNEEAIEKVIHDGLMNCESNIDLKQYAIPTSDIMKYFQNVINTSPELFYVQGRLAWVPTAQGTVDYIMPQYATSGTELEQQRATYNKKMKEILDLVNNDWSDLEKIIFLHDYLAQNYVYWIDPNPIKDSNGNTISDKSNYDAYGFLTEGHGVCQAYTLVYLGLLKEVGITASVASSPAMNHIWNLVQLNGKWYHVDVTWDDPVPDSYGNANHNYLLLSDTAIQDGSSRTPHYGWSVDIPCTDTTYDSAEYFWTQFSTPFKEVNGTWYTVGYSDADKACHLYSVDFAQRSVTSIRNIGRWNMVDNYYSPASYSGLNIYDNKLYFNTESSIMSYDPSKTGEDAFETVFTPNAGKSIGGMLIQDSTLNYKLMKLSVSDNHIVITEEEMCTYNLPELPQPAPSEPLSPGDMDGDKKITINDAFIVLKGVIGAYTLSDAQQAAANMNSDTIINLDDVRIILRIAMRIDTLND